MPDHNYDGLPAAATFEQSIALAQLIILRDLERRNKLIQQQAENPDTERKAA